MMVGSETLLIPGILGYVSRKTIYIYIYIYIYFAKLKHCQGNKDLEEESLFSPNYALIVRNRHIEIVFF